VLELTEENEYTGMYVNKYAMLVPGEQEYGISEIFYCCRSTVEIFAFKQSCAASNKQFVTDVSGKRFGPTFKDEDVQENYFGHKFFLYVMILEGGINTVPKRR